MSDVTRDLRIIGPGVAASWLTNLAPDPNLPYGLGYVPFVSGGERLLGFAGGVYNAGSTLLNHFAGTNLPYAETLPAIGQRAAETEDQIYKQLGGVDAETPAEEILKAGSSGLGAFGPLRAAGAVAPGVLRYVTSLLPSTAHAGRTMAIGAGIGGGSEAALQALGDGQAQAAEPPQAQTPASTTVTPQRPSLFPSQATTDPLGAVATVGQTQPPQRRSLFENVPSPEQTAESVVQDTTAPVSDTGKSPYTIGQAVVVLLGALAGTYAGRSMARMGSRMGAAESAARAADPQYAQQAQDYNNAKIARTGNQISQTDLPQPPLPPTNVVYDWLQNAKNWGVDATTNIQKFIKLTSDNPSVGEKLAHQVGNAFNDQMWEQEFHQFAVTGHDPASGVTIPSPMRYAADIENLPTDKQKLFNDTVNARDEINNRDEMIRQGIANNTTTDPNVLRHNFYRQSRQDLEAIVTQGMSDPIINDIVVRHDLIGQGLLDIMNRRNYITDADRASTARVHPHFLPEGDREGRIRQVFGPRVLAPQGGIEQINTKASSLMAQHIEAVMRDVKMNEVRRAVIDHILDYQRRTPTAPEFVYQSVQPNPLVSVQQPYPQLGTPATSSREQIVPVRRNTGTEYYRVDNNEIYDGLTGENITRAKIHFDSMGKWRQLLQAGTTGAASLVTGRLVPLRNLAFTSIMAPINAPKGYYGGPLSYATGGRLPRAITAPIDIPANIVGSAGTYALGVMNRRALNLSNAFRPDNQNFATQLMTSMIGPQRMRALSDNLMDYYMKSPTYEAAVSGVGGQSLQQRMRMPVLSREEGSNRTIRLQMAQIEPRILINQDGSASMRPFLINARRMVTDAFVHMSEATHDFLYRLNKNNPNFSPEQLATETRQIVGDPSISGAGRLPQAVRTQVPYSNVAVQGVGRLGRAYLESPVGTSMAMISALGTAAAASLLSTFQSQANLQHYTNELSDQERAANFVFYNGSGGAQHAVMIPLPQEVRPFWPLMQQVLHTVFNMTGSAADKETRTDVLTFLKDFLGTHIEKSNIAGTEHGINDAFNFLDIPPYIKLGLSLAGGSGRLDLARIWDDFRSGNLGLNSVINKPSDDTPLPGESPNDATRRSADGKRWSALLSSAFGLAGATLDNVFDVARYHAQGQSWLDSVGNSYHDWLQGLKDYNPQANTLLWENQVRLAKSPPIVEQVQRALVELRKTEGAFGRSEEQFGTTGGRTPLPVPTYGQDTKMPTDPKMRDMYILSSGMLTELNRNVLPEINNIRKQMDAVDAQGMDPTAKRQWMNERTRELADKYRFVQSRIDDLNKNLSSIAGTPVDISKGINWQRGVDQF